MTDDKVERAIGRLEGKVDAMTDKLDHLGDNIGTLFDRGKETDEAVVALETRCNERHSKPEKRSLDRGRAMIWVAIIGGIFSLAVTAVALFK